MNRALLLGIIVGTYSHVFGPLAGYGGRVFLLEEGRVFLETRDWIS